MIDRTTVDRVLAAADIVDVVGDFVTLRRSGANYKGLCPFHDEKTPSFMVSPSKQLCKCFSCGNGGNVAKFVMLHEQLTFPEAIKWLGRRYGIEVREKELSDEEKASASAREAMFVVNEWARDYFVDTLHNNVDGVAVGMSYFRRRGLRDDIIRKFQLGYSLEQRDAMALSARKKGFEEKYLESTGLCYRTDDGKLLDRYHGRVIFPVHSVSGRVVAFGGRVLNTEQNKNVGKYVNSPESEIYSKKRELYGLYLAKQAIVKQERCFLVEGYLDVISMHQSGIENVVASSGTSLTKEQVRLIHRFTENVTVLYDGDAAGIHASLRGIDMLLSEGLNIKILLLPEGEDPDSFAQSHSAEAFRAYIEENQTDFMRFKTDLLMKDAAGDPMKRAEVIRDIVRSIAVIPSDIVRQVYVHELSGRLGMEEAVIVSEVGAEIRKMRAEARNEAERRRANEDHASQTPVPMPNGPATSGASSASSPPPPSPFAPAAAPLSETPVAPSPGAEEEIPIEAIISGGTAGQTPTPVPPTPMAWSGAGKVQLHLEACERELLELVLRYGECPVIVPPEPIERRFGGASAPTPTANEIDSPLVAPYVYDELMADDLRLRTPFYQDILEEAAAQAETEGFCARDYFLAHGNPEIGKIADALTGERYELSTVQQQLFVPEEKRLDEIVPRVINDYKHAILQMQKEEIMIELRNPDLAQQPERINELMQRLVDINQLEMAFAKILGDRVLSK